MNVVIIEDEPLAIDKLERYLKQYDSSVQILAKHASLETAVPWIQERQNEVDLFFMDIQLTDGLSFEIFNKTDLKKPVIFTTAYDEFAIEAFRVNSIDYLLKPLKYLDLSRAIQKLEGLREQFQTGNTIAPVVKQLQKGGYKDRFLVRIGNHLHSIQTEDAQYFYAEGRDVYLVTTERKRYIIPHTLEHLEEMLAPKQFFRVNRSFYVGLKAIKDVTVFSNRRLKLAVAPKWEKEVVVSREKVNDFKRWFEGLD